MTRDDMEQQQLNDNSNRSASSTNSIGSSSSRRRHLLVDYSKNSANTTEEDEQAGLHSAATSRRQQQQSFKQRPSQQMQQLQQMQLQAPRRESNIPAFVFVKSNESSRSLSPQRVASRHGVPPSSPAQKVSFKLRRELVDRDNFLHFMKLHFSESDLDLQRANSIACESDTQSILSETMEAAHHISSHSQSFHTSTASLVEDLREKRSRRNNLEETLKNSAHLRLDKSPLSDSFHDHPLFSLPVRSSSYHGATRTRNPLALAATGDDSAEGSRHKTSNNRHSPRRSRSRSTSRRRPGIPRINSTGSGGTALHLVRATGDDSAERSRSKTSNNRKSRRSRSRSTSRRRPGVPRINSTGSGTALHLVRAAAKAGTAARRGAIAHNTTTNTTDGDREKDSYLPSALQMGGNQPTTTATTTTNRRTMMQRQSSFVTGSRIRTLRA